MLSFHNPWWLLALFFVPLIWLFRLRFRKRNYLVYPNVELLEKVDNKTGRRWKYLKMLFQTAALSVIIVALARPQLGVCEQTEYKEGVDIVLCLDASGSMQAVDFISDGQRVDRLSVVKKVVSDFVHVRRGDRIGVVVFGKEAFTLCPLTLDHQTILHFLKEVDVGIAGDLTALGSALVLGTKRLRDRDIKSRVLVLLTDGRHNSGSITPLKGAYLARALGIRVYTVGVGTQGIVPFQANTALGRQIVYRKVDTDEDTLRKIAFITGGKYFKAGDIGGLQEVCKNINLMEKATLKHNKYVRRRELYPWFVGLCILLTAITEVLSNTSFREIT